MRHHSRKERPESDSSPINLVDEDVSNIKDDELTRRIMAALSSRVTHMPRGMREYALRTLKRSAPLTLVEGTHPLPHHVRLPEVARETVGGDPTYSGYGRASIISLGIRRFIEDATNYTQWLHEEVCRRKRKNQEEATTCDAGREVIPYVLPRQDETAIATLCENIARSEARSVAVARRGGVSPTSGGTLPAGIR